MNLKKQVIGTRHFGNSIDITDPCYNKDVWCRLNNVKIQEGEYQCVIWTTDGSDDWGIRVAQIEISLTKKMQSSSEIFEDYLGDIGVDAGLAGFFENKPDFSNEEWDRFCDFMENEDAFLTELGFWSSSGYGDGVYGVFAHRNGLGTIIGLQIEFIYDEDEDDFNEDEEDDEFEIYWDDLSAKCQEDLLKFLGENGNYDTFPITTIYKNKE